MTRQGQQQFLTALWQTVKAVPQGRGEGVIYWEPDFIPQAGAGWKAGAGDEWDNVTLFDFKGRALPGLKTFAEAVK
jgi:arabinogalactan endo-1,4-beta-galactosidase